MLDVEPDPIAGLVARDVGGDQVGAATEHDPHELTVGCPADRRRIAERPVRGRQRDVDQLGDSAVVELQADHDATEEPLAPDDQEHLVARAAERSEQAE